MFDKLTKGHRGDHTINVRGRHAKAIDKSLHVASPLFRIVHTLDRKALRILHQRGTVSVVEIGQTRRYDHFRPRRDLDFFVRHFCAYTYTRETEELERLRRLMHSFFIYPITTTKEIQLKQQIKSFLT